MSTTDGDGDVQVIDERDTELRVTDRSLRLALVLAVLMLGVSVVAEVVRSPARTPGTSWLPIER